MKKLAIIGASYLQESLIRKAKSMGIETHVFAWASNDVGEKSADYFYPISIVEKEVILRKCMEIGIDGICSIASDLAVITVNFVANAMELIGNTMECTDVSTNKYSMRKRFNEKGDPSPKSILVKSAGDLYHVELQYPVIVKPTDRSGSRGIRKLQNSSGMQEAIAEAVEQSFEKCALVEEFAVGREYSVECISWKGTHYFLAVTKKYTTGAPHFIETAHLQPALISEELLEAIKRVVFHALDSLEIRNGASHSELKITDNGQIVIIEIGGRMGGDCIGSDMVELSTGIDFIRAVIQVALNIEPVLEKKTVNFASAVRFVFSNEDLEVLNRIVKDHPNYIVHKDIPDIREGKVTDSSSRLGYYLLKADHAEDLEEYLPDQTGD